MSIESVSEPRKVRGGSAATTLDRLPPHSEENERGVLGCILQAPAEALNACGEAGMSDRWFYDLRHQILFATLADMNAKGMVIDFITVMTRLKADGNLERCSGIEYLNQLQEGVPSAANLPAYLQVVREQWQLRQLVATCSDIVGRAYDWSGRVDELMGSVERQIGEVTAPAIVAKEQTINEILPVVVDGLENYHKGKLQLQGLPTGLSYLDKVIGGIDSQNYWVVAGRPGSGKTTFALDVINHLSTDYEWWKDTGEKHENGEPKMQKMKGIPIGVFSLEMSNTSLGRRLLFSMARVSAGKFKQGFMSNEDFQKLIGATNKLAKAKIYLDEEPKQTIGKIRAKAIRMARQYGIKLFVLDYLQLVKPDTRNHRDDRVQELADISSELVCLKKKLNIPWLVLAQMNRNIETAERVRVPVMSDLRNCGDIEQDADGILFLHKPSIKETEEDDALLESHYAGVEFSERPRRIDAVIAKNRENATGTAQLLFHSNQFHFEDWRKWKVNNNYAEGAKGETYKAPELPTEEELNG